MVRLTGNGPEGALIIDAKGSLYSTTRSGGSGTCGEKPNLGCSTVFELSPGSSVFGTKKLLYSFLNDGKDGAGPAAGLTPDGKGSVFGTAFIGGLISGGCGAGCGTMFKLTP